MTQLNDSEKIEILIDQVGRMTESITELRMSLTDLRSTVVSGFDELKTISQRQAEAAERQSQSIDRLAQIQERNVDRLVGIVEALIQERR